MPPTGNPYPIHPFPRPPPASRADILPSSPVPRLPTRPRRRQPAPARLNPHPCRPRRRQHAVGVIPPIRQQILRINPINQGLCLRAVRHLPRRYLHTLRHT